MALNKNGRRLRVQALNVMKGDELMMRGEENVIAEEVLHYSTKYQNPSHVVIVFRKSTGEPVSRTYDPKDYVSVLVTSHDAQGSTPQQSCQGRHRVALHSSGQGNLPCRDGWREPLRPWFSLGDRLSSFRRRRPRGRLLHSFFRIRKDKELVNHVKALEVRLSAMGIGIQYMAQVVDEYDHDVEEDDHMRRFMAKLVKCVAPERQFEHCEMDYQVLLHALNDRTGEDEESKIANSNFEDDGDF